MKTIRCDAKAVRPYEYLVRYTFIGAVLNGRKHRPTAVRTVVDTPLDRSTAK